MLTIGTLVIVLLYALDILLSHKRQITLIANGGMIVSSRRRREMLHEAGQHAMGEFNKAAK